MLDSTDIYGFTLSAEKISEITDRVLEELNEWQNRPLKKVYPFVFVDCMYVTIRKDYEVKETAVYTILGYDLQGKKDILGLWLNAIPQLFYSYDKAACPVKNLKCEFKHA